MIKTEQQHINALKAINYWWDAIQKMPAVFNVWFIFLVGQVMEFEDTFYISDFLQMIDEHIENHPEKLIDPEQILKEAETLIN